MEKQLKSKLKPLYIFFAYLFSVPLLVLSMVVGWRIIKGLRQDIPVSGNTWFAFILCLALFVVVRLLFLKAFPVIIVTTEGVWFKRIFRTTLYRWEDIYDIKLTGKWRQEFSGALLEATVIQLHDLRRVHFWVDMYSNIGQLRMALQEAMKLATQPGRSIEALNLDGEHKHESAPWPKFEAGKIYKGNPLFTSAGFLSCFFVAMIICLIALTPVSAAPKVYGMLVFVLGVFFVLGYWSATMQLNYFELTPHYLVVRNHIRWWQRKIYVLTDIRELVIEAPPKRATTLRLTTIYFEDKPYSGDSLRSASWRALIRDLRSKGVNVRDEVFGGFGN